MQASREFHCHLSTALHANHFIVILALILAIIRGTDVFSTDSTKWACGQELFHATAALFVTAWLMVGCAWLIYWPNHLQFNQAQLNLYLVAGLVGVLSLFVHILYTICIATTINTDHTQVFNPITGSWITYLLLSFLPKVIVSLFFVTTGLLSPLIQKTKRTQTM